MHRNLPTFICFLLLAFAVGTSVWAQEDADSTVPDYEAWSILVKRAEGAIDTGRASDTAFESVREEIVQFRQLFRASRDGNSIRIERLQSQIDALGIVPESGDEPSQLAGRRAELTQQLQNLLTPSLAAQEAFSQADGLITEIDRILVERRKNETLKRGPSPLNLTLWPKAWGSLVSASHTLMIEVQAALTNPLQRDEFNSNLPLFVLCFALGSVLILRGYRWSERLGDVIGLGHGVESGVGGTFVSICRIALPIAGVMILTQSLFLTGLVGLRGTLVVDQVPVWGAVILGIYWLCLRVFAQNDNVALIPLPSSHRRRLRLYGTLLAVMYVLRELTNTLMEIENASDTSIAVVSFAMILLSSLLLFRFGIIFVQGQPFRYFHMTDSAPLALTHRIIYTVGQASIAIVMFSVVMSGLGYVTLTEAIFYPTIWSLALGGSVKVLQRVVTDIYEWLSGRGDEARGALVPTLLGFLFVLASLPLLALIWGARPTQVVEVWTRFNEGISFGDVRISSADFLIFVVIFVIGYTATRFVKGTLKTSLLPKTGLDPGSQVAIVSGIGYVGVFVSAIVAIAAAGINLSSLAIVAGALSVGIGFGLQNIVSNFVSGIILLIERPISEGDWIEVNGKMGYVRNISVRSTRIETFDRTDVILPNADLVSGTVTNFTRGNTIGRLIVSVGVAYGTDTYKVESLLREIAECHPQVSKSQPPSIIFQGLGADSLDFEIRAILDDVNWLLSVKSDLNHEINRRFMEEGIEIPFAQRDIWLRNPEAVQYSNNKIPV
ncbi:MAG: DUF3772 domain-containing protein [Aestuariivita sp.]|nr:DUF3772 domain-containing protein [Aestuariivita sp.]